MTRVQRGVNARVGDEKEIGKKAGNGMSLSCVSCFLGAQHDNQLLIHASPFKMVIDPPAWSRGADSGLATAGPESRNQSREGLTSLGSLTPGWGLGREKSWCSFFPPSKGLRRRPPLSSASALVRRGPGWSSHYLKPVLCTWSGGGGLAP